MCPQSDIVLIIQHFTPSGTLNIPDPTTMSEYIPLPSEGAHGEKNGTATATCYCGAVQITVPTSGPGLLDAFICNCTDCRKITARYVALPPVPFPSIQLTQPSMFASNLVVQNTHLKHVRGEDKLTRFRQKKTIASGNYMENSFCSVCGTLMYRRSSAYPDLSIPRIGTVDDFGLQETAFKPRIEMYAKDRCGWLEPARVAQHSEGPEYSGVGGQ